MRLGHHSLRLLLWAFLLSAAVSVSAETPPLKWLDRIDVAQQAAAAAGKDLLILFTGHGWCHYCTLLDREVFQQPQFVAASDDFVLVEVNFSAVEADDADPVDAKLRAQYAEWKKHYLIEGVPVVVLADATGRPYAYTGYETGITPESFLEELRLAKTARRLRDEKMALAEKSTTPADRAVLLHAGLQAIASLIVSEEKREDPLLVFYADVVAEIRALDAKNAAHLREIYDARSAARDAKRQHHAQYLAQLDEFKARKDYAGAIDHLDKMIPTITDEQLSWHLEHSRQVFLEWDRRFDRALENARRLMKDPRISPEEYTWLEGREAFDLVNSGQIDQYIAQWNNRLAAAAGNQALRRRLLNERAHHLFNKPDTAPSIAAWQEYRRATAPGSDDWENATFLLARELARAKDYPPAIALWTELLSHYRQVSRHETTGLFLVIAEAQRDAGLCDDARQSLAAAGEALQTELEYLRDPGDRKYLQQRLEKLRESLQP